MAEGAQAEVAGSSVGLDVRDYAAVEARVDAAAAAMGGLDHVVCTAGVLRIGPIADTDPAVVAEVIDVNLTGSLNVARAAYRHLCASRGSITFFASSSFTRGRPDYVAYSASKAALVNVDPGPGRGVGRPTGSGSTRSARSARTRRCAGSPSRARTGPGCWAPRTSRPRRIRLLRSDLTGQVVDVKRHDVVGA